MLKKTLKLFLVLLAFSSCNLVHARIIRVNHASTSPNFLQTGTSWSSAFENLRTAMSIASTGDEIWIAQGTYYPTTPVNLSAPTTSERDKSFLMKANMKLIGGFFGNETSSSQANSTSYPTILSGDIDRDGILDTDNSYSVISIPTNSINSLPRTNIGNCLIENIIIKHGFASQYSKAVWSRRHGGGLYLYRSSGQLTLENCKFIKNASRDAGGGMYIGGSSVPSSANLNGLSLQVYNCEFIDNNYSTFNISHSDLYVSSEDFILKNSSFTNAQSAAGGIYTYYISKGIVENCQFNNISSDVLYLYDSKLDFLDCSFINNTGLIINAIYKEVTLERCSFKGNNGSSRLILDNSSGMTIRNTSFENNNTSIGPLITFSNYLTLRGLNVVNCSFNKVLFVRSTSLRNFSSSSSTFSID